MNPDALPPLFGRAVRRIHCVGAGGTGLGPLAIYLARTGFSVTGEDRELSPPVRRQLELAGVTPGPLPAACDLLVRSSAIPLAHPACAAAQSQGVPVARRGEVLAEVLRGRKLVAVCGSHGKTTTTAMLVSALGAAGFPAGHVLGGFFADATLAPAAVAAGDWVVAEVDESDGTIGCFAPEITVVVNLDWDHPDHYRQPGDIEAAFAALMARTRGPVLVNAACARSRRLAAQALTFGADGDYASALAGTDGELLHLRLGGAFAIKEAWVRAGGQFNAANATAALAAAQLMGADLNPGLLAGYAGVQRRQHLLRAGGGLTVIEDYAHHPAEISALLGALRPRVRAGGRLVVVFQPHRYSRTAQFRAAFAAALRPADHIHLLDVYGAGEAPVPGGTTADLAAELAPAAGDGRVDHHRGGEADLCRALWAAARAGDLVAFVGAGDIDRMARRWLAAEPRHPLNAAHWDEVAAALAPGLGAETRLRREEPLGPRTTMRVGGAARLYAEPAQLTDLQVLVRGAAARGVPLLLLGRGSNLLVPDEGVDGLVVNLGHENWATFEPQADGRVWAGAGLRLKNLCGKAATAGLAGFEFLEGIPGNLGGALRMNAGAMGGWIFDVVDEVRLMTRDGEVRTLARSALHVDYRHCRELESAIALGALLRPAAPAAAEAVARQIVAYRRKRQESQPREPSAGCIFKNPPGDSAGRLIDRCGLKGERVGDAEVSAVHANFIVNRGRATAADVLGLVRRVRARVQKSAGVTLEPEVLLYGRNWEDVL